MPQAHSDVYRAGEGEPLVLLHGFTGTWRHWRPLLGPLSQRFQVIAPTLAGHEGGPLYGEELEISMSASADAVELQLDELGVDSAHFVGNSMGGGLALELAKRQRARSVVAIAPAGGWTAGDGEAQRIANFFARQRRVTRVIQRRVGLMMSRPRTRKFMLRDIMRRGDLLTRWEATDLALSGLGCTVSERAIAALREDRGIVIEELERIRCPVLLLTSEHDRVLPPRLHAPRYASQIAAVQLHQLSDAGHVPMWDQRDLLISMISEFVGRHCGAASAEMPAVTTAS